MELLLTTLAAYLIGSIPFGFVLTRLAGQGDIRQIGSGNIGATNVLRTGRKGLAALTLLLDGLKGVVSILLARFILTPVILGDPLYGPDVIRAVSWVGLATIIGHVFPVWLKFKGGKGVATTLGVWFGINPIMGSLAVVIWLFTALLTRWSSLAAIVSILLTVVILTAIEFVCWPVPGEAPICTPPQYMTLAPYWLIAALVIFRHKDNIKRLLAGTEPKIGRKHD
jgi:glycerol-3-phosphate acyltransferase PlsY